MAMVCCHTYECIVVIAQLEQELHGWGNNLRTEHHVLPVGGFMSVKGRPEKRESIETKWPVSNFVN